MANSRIYKEWRRRIASGQFTEGQCRQWCHTVVALDEGFEAQGHRTVLTYEEAGDLRAIIRACGPVTLTATHEAKGLAWIRQYGEKEGLPGWAVEHFVRFSFPGNGLNLGGAGYRPSFVPIYRIHTSDGLSVDYAAASWQSGHRGEMYVEEIEPNGDQLQIV